MNNQYFLGIDVGTSSVKTAIIDENGKVLGVNAEGYRLIQEQPGHRQIDTEDMWSAFVRCVKRLKEEQRLELSLVRGIGISCLCPGLAAFDKEGRVLVNPIIYSDQRSVEEAELIKERVGEDCLFHITGNRIMAGAMSGTSMLWVKNHLPEVYASTHCFGHVNTLMGVRLTGNFAIDYSNASYTSLFETGGGYQWSEELCEKFGIPVEKLPPLMKSYEIVGDLNARDVIDIGIPAGTPVAIGGGDTACASLATGVVRNGDVCESVGTTDVLTVCVTEPKFDKAFINRCHVVDHAWIYQGALSHTGASLRWLRDELCPDLKLASASSMENAYDMMTELADLQSAPGANGIVFLPYMSGERSPIWDSYARGVFFGVSLDSKRADLIRAVLEGTAYGLRQLSEMAEAVTERPIRELKAIGGGAQSDVWTQIKADITGKTIISLDMKDMAPVGAALLAGIGAGCFKDVYEASERVEKKVYKKFIGGHEADAIYDKRFMVYKELYPKLRELYRLNH